MFIEQKSHKLLDDNLHLKRYLFVGTKRIKNLYWKVRRFVSIVDSKGILNIDFQFISLLLKKASHLVHAAGLTKDIPLNSCLYMYWFVDLNFFIRISSLFE